FFAGRGLAVMYIAPAPAANLTVERTPEQFARGRYLAEVTCVECHGTVGEDREFPLIGGTDLAAVSPPPLRKIVAGHPSPPRFRADRTDGELFRAIRYGYGKYQRAMAMSFSPNRQRSDEDTKAIIAFLRSQEPVTTATNGGDEVNILGVILVWGAGLQPLPKTN